MNLSSLDVPTIRAAGWAYRAYLKAKKDVAVNGLEGGDLPQVPKLPPQALRGVEGVLRRVEATCLVGALVRQAWFSAQGDPRDLIVGVTAPSSGFKAHAWLEGDPPCHEGFEELTRRSAR